MRLPPRTDVCVCVRFEKGEGRGSRYSLNQGRSGVISWLASSYLLDGAGGGEVAEDGPVGCGPAHLGGGQGRGDGRCQEGQKGCSVLHSGCLKYVKEH